VERDSKRVLELSKELNDALRTQAIDGDLWKLTRKTRQYVRRPPHQNKIVEIKESDVESGIPLRPV